MTTVVTNTLAGRKTVKTIDERGERIAEALGGRATKKGTSLPLSLAGWFKRMHAAGYDGFSAGGVIAPGSLLRPGTGKLVGVAEVIVELRAIRENEIAAKGAKE
jgi:hypothetical protein